MSDDALWKLVNGPAKPKLNLDLSRHDHRGDAGKFAVKPTDTPGKPAPDAGIGLNGSIRHPQSQNTLIIRKNGQSFTTAGIAMQYGIKLKASQENESISALVPLTGKQLEKLLSAVSDECMGLSDDDTPDPATKNTAAKAMRSSMKEGRQSSTGKPYPFGRKMRQLKSGGYVEAANPADMPKVILTDPLYGDWVLQGNQATSQLSKEILKGIN